MSKPNGVALILAGAAAKGAYEAGVLSVLMKRGLAIRHIVATSAGALNGTMIAAGIRAGRVAEYSDRLVEFWRSGATWGNGAHLSVGDAVGLRGLSDQRGLLTVLRDHVPVAPAGASGSIRLTVVVAPLNGSPVSVGDPSGGMTTHERALTFRGADFDDRKSIARVFDAAVASASVPFVFAPYDIGWSDDGGSAIGPCVDGGAVNNVPIKWAVGDDAAIDTVIVVSASPRVFVPPACPLAGAGLIGHLVEMLINERMVRDLKKAHDTNVALDRLDALGLGQAELAAVKVAAGLAGKVRLDIVAAFPDAPLRGNAFAGFRDAELRGEYLRIGVETAEALCEAKGW
jgi:NTE family protein